jgi:hypothetical protein
LKKESMGKYTAFAAFGLVLFLGGGALLVLNRDSTGIMLTLPYVMIGVGCGIFGGNLGTAVKIHLLRKGSPAARQAEIEEKDERNIAVRNMAKAKAYDMMVTVFGALILFFVLMRADLYLTLALIAAYMFVVGTNIYYICKYNKEI